MSKFIFLMNAQTNIFPGNLNTHMVETNIQTKMEKVE